MPNCIMRFGILLGTIMFIIMLSLIAHADTSDGNAAGAEAMASTVADIVMGGKGNDDDGK